MKQFLFPLLAPLAVAFLLPDQEIFQQLEIQGGKALSKPVGAVSGFFSSVSDKINKDVVEPIRGTADKIKTTLQSELEQSWTKLGDKFDSSFEDIESWSEEHVKQLTKAGSEFVETTREGPHHPHEPPPHDGHPPGHHPHCPPHGNRNLTLWQLISHSKYTTKFAALVNKYPDLVDTLNSTKANHTVFAPTNKAFEKIPDDHPEPSKEFLKMIIQYHISGDFYPAGRVLASRTIPTLLTADELVEDDSVPMRLSINIGPRGLTMNFYSRVVAVDIFGSNGVIHGVDSIIVPPRRVLDLISFLPTQFSTLELALHKTGLFDELKERHEKGGTFFAPTNFAFAKLGPRVNAFLFSEHGLKYLKALLQYHVVPKTTLYSDAVYNYNSTQDSSDLSLYNGHSDHKVPKGLFHFDLPTLLENKKLNVDVARYGGIVVIKLNGFSNVVIPDGIARNGVLHAVSDVLIPPKAGFPPFLIEDAENKALEEEKKNDVENNKGIEMSRRVGIWFE